MIGCTPQRLPRTLKLLFLYSTTCPQALGPWLVLPLVRALLRVHESIGLVSGSNRLDFDRKGRVTWHKAAAIPCQAAQGKKA